MQHSSVTPAGLWRAVPASAFLAVHMLRLHTWGLPTLLMCLKVLHHSCAHCLHKASLGLSGQASTGFHLHVQHALRLTITSLSNLLGHRSKSNACLGSGTKQIASALVLQQ